jgi:uncharacterized protein (TIGR03085 family)
MSEPLDARERAELCDLFEELGPDAPTLCEGWTTADLAAHLVVRERDPRSGPGIVLGGRVAAFERYTEKLMERAKQRGYPWLVGKVRSGSPIGPFMVPKLRTLLNFQEYVVHLEDVRRANGLGPRTGRPDLDAQVWALLRRGARMQVRNVKGFGVDLRWGDEVIAARTGDPRATIAGEPVDILLFLFGRKGAAQVEVTGDLDAVAAVNAAKMGI